MHRPLRKSKKKNLMPKPELVPVLDSMFIMIFFILATADFLKISEIGSDLPVMKLSAEENPEKKKLMLKMLLTPEKISLINEVDNSSLFSEPMNENTFQLLNEKVQELKKTFPDEERVMVTPDLTVKYEMVIKALDAVRQTEKSGIKIKLFNQIMFR